MLQQTSRQDSVEGVSLYFAAVQPLVASAAFAPREPLGPLLPADGSCHPVGCQAEVRWQCEAGQVLESRYRNQRFRHQLLQPRIGNGA